MTIIKKTRSEEQSSTKTWKRCERFFCTEEGWWFQTRENSVVGPFGSHDDAREELSEFLSQRVLVS